MPVDVVVGGQGGDEGKGKIVAYLSLNKDYDIGMRVPAPQAGHSIYLNGKRVGLANLPCSLVNPDLRLLIGIGGLISLERLLYGEANRKGEQIPPEIPTTGVTPERLGIDYMTRVVTLQHKQREEENAYLMEKVGSVGRGTSGCRIDTIWGTKQCETDTIMRDPDLPRAKDYEELKPYLTDTKKEIFKVLEEGGNILLEGDHGAKLDLIHGDYPYVTTRIVNEAGFISEAGIPSREVRDVYIILKPYVTRVAPGDLEEIFDKDFIEWAHNAGGEIGSVSGRDRRIGKFEWENVKEVVKMNGATKLVFTHMDCPKSAWKNLGYKDKEEFLNMVEKEICDKWPYPTIGLLSYGPKAEDVREYEF